MTSQESKDQKTQNNRYTNQSNTNPSADAPAKTNGSYPYNGEVHRPGETAGTQTQHQQANVNGTVPDTAGPDLASGNYPDARRSVGAEEESRRTPAKGAKAFPATGKSKPENIAEFPTEDADEEFTELL
jgi:hypothetical protein